MATIRTTFALADNMTRPIRHINSAMSILLDSLESMSRTMGSNIDTSALEEARNHISEASAAFDRLDEEIRQAGNEQQRFTQNIHKSHSAADGLLNKIKGIAVAVGGIAGIKKVIDLSDQITNTTARLSLIVDDGGSVEELERKIKSSAQRSRAAYLDTANAIASMGANAGSAFSGNDELIAFMEQINKQFVIGGASAQGQAAAMLQLTQAMAAGALRGEELNSILENAPGIARAIEQYMGVAEGSIKKYAEQGLITADVVKNAMFAAADETNAKFESMPMTWGQVWTSMKDQAITQMEPILAKINSIANNPEAVAMISDIVSGIALAINILVELLIQLVGYITNVYTAFTSWEGSAVIVDWIQTGLLFMIGVLQGLAQFVADVASAFVENWSWIAPIVYGIVTAIGLYMAVLGVMKAIEIATAAGKFIMCVATLAHAAATGAEVSATTAETAAQMGLNAAFLACPIFWIVAGVIALIAAITAAIRATNTFGAKSTSVLGTICGMVNVVIQFFVNLGLAVANIALGIWNALGACCSNIGTAFHNVIANVQGWFYGLLSTALHVVEGICAALNKLPFVEFDYSGITAKADEYAAKSAEAYGSVEDYQSISDAFNEGFGTFDAFSSGWAQDAFDSGAAFGDGILDGIGNFMDDVGAGTGMDGLFDFTQPEMGGMDGIGGMGGMGAYNMGNVADNIAGSSADTAGNTAAMADTLDYMEEDLKYMLDIAEREAINRFTTAEITVEQHNENHIEKDTDLDGIMDAWAADFAEKLDVSEEGVN